MSCFICKKEFDLSEGSTKYMSPSQLTCRLQDRKWEPGRLKPDVKIIEALEEITDGDVTLEVLRKHASDYICHECQVNLRYAVNTKAALENHIHLLNERVSQVSNDERKSYYRENYGIDKMGRCWGCLYQFVPADYQKKRSDRIHLASNVVEGISVGEAINTLLEHEAETLLGLYEKKVFICKTCLQLLRNVIKSQCVFDTLQTSFTSGVNKTSVFGRLLSGEAVTVDESVDTDGFDEGALEGMGSGDSSPSKSKSAMYRIKASRQDKRPFHKTLGRLPAVPKEISQNAKRRKVEQEIDSEDGDSDVEFDFDTDMDVNEISEHGETETGNIEPESVCGELEREYTEFVETDISYSDISGNFAAGSCESTDKDDYGSAGNLKKCIHVKVSLQGKEIKALIVNEDNKEESNEINDLKDEEDTGRKTKKEMDADTCPLIMTEDTELGKKNMSDDWLLYYYPEFSGRAEFIRLIFEDTGTPYKECQETFASIRKLIIEGEMEGYPHFAPPMIKKGSLQVSQTPVICRFLGEELGIYPDSKEDRLHAEQINQCCHDYIAEGRLAFHGIYPVGPYLSQKEETQPYIDRFVSERLPRWLKYFERVLASNNGGKGFLYGDKISYCDLGVFHILHATEAQFPAAYKSADYIPLLKDFKERIAARPRIAAYLKTDRWRGFSGDSMM